MVYVEERKVNNKKKFYLVKTIRKGKKTNKKRVFLGTNLNKTQLLKLKKDAMVELGEIDFKNVLTEKEKKEFTDLKQSLNKLIKKFDKKNFYELFISEFTYDSNAIEGSTLTIEETNQILFEGISPGGKPLIQVQEAKNHKEAYDFVSKLKNKKIDKKLICDIQRIVVKKTMSSGIGCLRDVNVRVGVHVAPPFYSVPRKLTALIKWFNLNKNIHPIISTAYFHALFEEIHPFVDGNGRTGRLLMNHMLKNKGYPPLIIFFEQRKEYYKSLEKARREKDLKPLIKVMKKGYVKMLKKFDVNT